MEIPINYLCLEKLCNTPVSTHPYPLMVIENFINCEKINDICRDFPSITQGGSFPLSNVAACGEFAKVIQELNSSDFLDCIAEKFAVNLTGRSTMITLRGYSRQSRDGRVHTD